MLEYPKIIVCRLQQELATNAIMVRLEHKGVVWSVIAKIIASRDNIISL